jgi:hypothetical protein
VQFVGHLAAGALAAAGGAKLRGVRPTVLWALVPGALGGVTPDLVDKAILALEASRYGRTVGHSLVFLAVMAAAWALARRWGARGAARPLGFWALGVGTHLLVDLADDALRGLIHGGQAFYSFFAWPFATPYAWVVRNPHPLGVWPWAVTPLEVAVLAGAVVWLAGVGWRAWWGRVGGGVAPETAPMP